MTTRLQTKKSQPNLDHHAKKWLQQGSKVRKHNTTPQQPQQYRGTYVQPFQQNIIFSSIYIPRITLKITYPTKSAGEDIDHNFQRTKQRFMFHLQVLCKNPNKTTATNITRDSQNTKPPIHNTIIIFCNNFSQAQLFLVEALNSSKSTY